MSMRTLREIGLVTLETLCPLGHPLKILYAKNILELRLNNGQLPLCGHKCDRYKDASAEQKIKARKLLMG